MHRVRLLFSKTTNVKKKKKKLPTTIKINAMSYEQEFVTWRCLTICENGSIISSQNVCDNGLCRFIVDFILCSIWFEYFIEEIYFALKSNFYIYKKIFTQILLYIFKIKALLNALIYF